MTIQKVAVIGANGKLGPAVLEALLSAGSFTVTIISRSSSKSQYPDSVHVVHVADDLPKSGLVSALKGQDALVVIFAGSNSDLQIRLADAAVEAGVKRFIPADFGSCDSGSPKALELMPLYRAKEKVRQYLQELASSGTGLSWTSLVCGHFFDFGLKSGLLLFDVKARKALIFDGGEIKWSTTTVDTIAIATMRILQKEEETKNRMLYIQSFSMTQNELLRSVEKATGLKWQVENVGSKEFIEGNKARTDKDPDDDEARENLVGVVGIVDANWESKGDFANFLLGLKSEDLDQVVRKVIES